MKNKVEILAPAGSMDSLIAAVNNGADAVYLGASRFGARAYAGNFDEQQLQEAVRYAHARGVRIYVTFNTLIYENEVEEAMEMVDFLYHSDVDALIIQDIGMVSLIRQAYPDFELHASTQMHIHNRQGVRWVKEMGLSRAVLARETPIELVRECAEEGLELEIFVYGALCVCYSGECLMSSINGGRSGNRGQCAQPCRLPYELVELETGKTVPTQGEYLLSPKDLNTLDNIEELIESGATSFKIEGRMKRPEYVGAVVRAYRQKVDEVLARRHSHYTDQEEEKLKKLFNRGFTEGYLFHQSGFSIMNQQRPNHVGVSAGQVIACRNGRVTVRLTRDLHQGDGLRILQKKKEDVGFIANYIYSNGLLTNSAPSGSTVEIQVKEKVSTPAALLLTTDSQLMKEIQNDTAQLYRRTPVDFIVEGQAGEPLKITACDREGHRVVSFSEQPLQPAQKAPLDRQRLTSQFSKLNDTPYTLGEITVDLSGDLFIPVQQINQARREAVSRLTGLREVEHPDRTERHPVSSLRVEQKECPASILVQVETEEQALALMDLPVQLVSSWPQLVRKYPEAILPATLRVQEHPSVFHEPLMVSEEIGSLVNTGSSLICTSGFNVTNSYSLALLLAHPQVCAVEFSLETTPEQQKEMRSCFQQRVGFNANTVQFVYGYRDLMVSKACAINRTLKDGTKTGCRLCHEKQYALRNRKGELFSLFGDAACYNHCLESLPYELAGNQLDQDQIWKLRMTIESAGQARETVLDYLRQRKK